MSAPIRNPDRSYRATLIGLQPEIIRPGRDHFLRYRCRIFAMGIGAADPGAAFHRTPDDISKHVRVQVIAQAVSPTHVVGRVESNTDGPGTDRAAVCARAGAVLHRRMGFGDEPEQETDCEECSIQHL